MIKLILIDIDDTLLDFNECSKLSMQCALAKRGMPYNDEIYETFHRINNALWEELEQRIITRSELFRTRWSLIFQALRMDADCVSFEEDFIRGLAQSAVRVEGAKELLEYLSAKYTVCAASNGSLDQQTRRLRSAGLLDSIRQILSSEELGSPKPSLQFFEACFRMLNNEFLPEETMMIGDSITADIRGGNDFGLHTCWFNIHGKSAPFDCVPEYTVRRLAEIREIL